MIIDAMSIDRADFEAGTGWLLKPEGACKGEVCIPLTNPPAADDTQVDVAALAEQMGLPLVEAPGHGVWSLGPDAVASRTLVSAEAPELTLPDLDGNMFSLSSLRGQKVLLVAWSPY